MPFQVVFAPAVTNLGGSLHCATGTAMHTVADNFWLVGFTLVGGGHLKSLVSEKVDTFHPVRFAR